MFVLNCPMCSRSLQLHDQATSATIVCPHCHKKIKLAFSQSSPGDAPSPAASASGLPPLPPIPMPMPAAVPTQRQGGSGFFKAMLWIFLIPAVLLIGAGGYYWYFHLRSASPLTPYADLLPGDTLLALEMNLAEIAATPGFEAEATKLAKAYRATFKDLDLEPRSAGLMTYFHALGADEQTLSVWSFDQPIAFGKPLKGRFSEVQGNTANGRRLLADRYQAKQHWAVDARGRLLLGPRAKVQAALDQQANGVASEAVADLERAAKSIPGKPALWLAADLTRETRAAHVLLPVALAREFQDARINGLACFASLSEEQGMVLKGKAACPTDVDCQNTLAALEKIKKSFNRLTTDKLNNTEWRLLGKFLTRCSFDINDRAVEMELPVPVALGRLAFEHQTAGIATRQKAIVQAIRKDMRDLAALAEKEFAAEKFKEAESAQTSVVDLAPGNAAAQEKLKEITAAREKKERFLACLAACQKAIDGLDADVAKSNLAEARALRGHDPAIPELEKKFAVLEKRLNFNKVVAEGDKALSKKDFALAQEKFASAAALGFDGDKIKATLEIIRRVVMATGHLQSARKHLDGKAIDEALADADKIKEAILGDRRAVIAEDPRFKDTAAKLGANTLDLLINAAKAARLPSQALRNKGEKLYFAKNYPDAEKEYRSALKSLQQARDVLAKVSGFSLKDDFGAVDTESKLIDFEVESIAREADKCKGLAAQKRGREFAKEGREQFELGKKDGALLFKAQEKFKEAVKCFEDSVAVPGILAADDLKEAKSYLLRVMRIIEPVDLDFAKERDLKDWGPLPKGWRFRAGKELGWLQTDLTTPTGAFSSPLLDLPTDFSLRLQICVVDDAGEIRNNAWKSFPEMLTIVLVTRGEKNLAMSIGRDPKSRQLETALAIGSRTHSLSIDADRGPIPLVLSRRQDQISVEIAGRAVASAISPGEIQRITFLVKNGAGPSKELRYFPAFTSIALSLSTKTDKGDTKDAKASRLERTDPAMATTPAQRQRLCAAGDRHPAMEILFHVDPRHSGLRGNVHVTLRSKHVVQPHRRQRTVIFRATTRFVVFACSSLRSGRSTSRILRTSRLRLRHSPQRYSSMGTSYSADHAYFGRFYHG